MYINSKHLQILHLIKNNPSFNLKDLSEILDLSQQHIKLYLNDIYEEISKKNVSSLKSNDLLTEIIKFKGARKILRKSQHFTKNQKVFYFLFFLSESKNINFSNISKELGLTTRNLNNYKEDVNNLLINFNLKLDISSQGIKLIGSDFNLKRIHFFLFFKFIIEKDYLPYKFRKDVLNNLNLNNFSKLNNDIYNFLNLLNSQYSTHKQAILLSFYIAFKGDKTDKIVDQVSSDYCFKYKPGNWSKEFFYEVFYFLKNSSFKDIKTESLYLLFNIIDTFCYFKIYLNKTLMRETKAVQKIFSKHLGEHILDNPSFFSIINKWLYYCKIKQLFFIDDFSFINLNLKNIPNSTILNITKEINKIFSNFTIFEGIFLWLIFYKNKKSQDINILIFKNLEEPFIPIIMDEIYKKHDIEITKAINLKKCNKYLKNNKIDNIIIIENIRIYNNNIPIKKLYFPIPNYNKSEK